MKSADIRQRFLDYFARHGHELVPSSSLVPINDPTLLFTNAGMIQFKDVFLGQEKRSYDRAASSQRCVRAGGKHNDLENVGYTARHHTFFEMLGNFSFGDYFKREAIQYAWEFLTKEMQLDSGKLWVTVYKDDNEAADIWLKELKVDPGRFSRLGEKDNFWSMGDVGPCGPCSEIFYDHGPEIAGGPPGSSDEDSDRYVEIWNLVFMQYDRDSDGKLTPLPKPSVDTGMGLERLAAVLQGVHSNYEIDLFQGLIKAAAKLLNVKTDNNKALNVIADHIRSAGFLIIDGVSPSNEGRGYVLRRIIRRAIRHGHQLGSKDPFFYKLLPALVKQMGEAYPELEHSQTQIEKVIRQEEERFAETLDHGMGILEDDIAKLKGKVISGKTLFQLYDTYGFPVDLTADIARERNLDVDMAGFEKEMAQQRQRARAASHFNGIDIPVFNIETATAITGYKDEEGAGTILAIVNGAGASVQACSDEKDRYSIVLDQTPFYAESGGQIGDRGRLADVNGQIVFEVLDTQKLPNGVVYHTGQIIHGKKLQVGDSVQAIIPSEDRQFVYANHSATHLMHAALRKILGEHVTQKGSLVAPNRLRFDFSHPQPLTSDQIQAVEDLVNEQIQAKIKVNREEGVNIEEAKSRGAMALFGEKYGDEVTVVQIAEFSTELCGGTHVSNTEEIGLFHILSETGVAAGIRRIEACTTKGARDHLEISLSDQNSKNRVLIKENEKLIKEIIGSTQKTDDATDSNSFIKENTAAIISIEKPDFNALSGEEALERYNIDKDKLDVSISQITEQNKKLKKELDRLKQKHASTTGDELAGKASDVNGVMVLAEIVDGADSKVLRETLDRLKDKLGKAAIVLASVSNGKVALVAGVTKNLTSQLHAGELIKSVAGQVGGKGGGRPDMAQAGGNSPAKLGEALTSVAAWVEQQLSK